MTKFNTDSVFFGEKGLTSTSAQHIKDMAGHFIENTKAQLEEICFVNEEVKLIGSQSRECIKKGWTDLSKLADTLESIAKAQSLQAWLGEAIKAKKCLSEGIQYYGFTEYLQDNYLELPNLPESSLLTETEWINSLDIKTRNRYLELQTLCAVYGQFIHPKKPFDKAKKYLQIRLNEPVEVTGSGRDALVYYFEPSIGAREVDEVYFQLQAQHRAYQAEFNKLKHKYELAADKYAEEQHLAIQKIREEREAKRQEYLIQYNQYIQEMSEKVRNLKIQIPDSLKDIYETVNKLGK